MSYRYMGKWTKGRLDPVLQHQTGIALDQNGFARAIAIDKDGRIAILDCNNHRIQFFDQEMKAPEELRLDTLDD
ncbi:hypothetical protein ACFFSY_19455 [Paenibacillus aurantiacus]|uniref:Uncharacterized protein n=1 Tax=Paenibacillus aurantiacus TaxID=1936118 RepID=A0ABV5KTD5_9BACL